MRFDSYHPAINVIFFVSVMTFSFIFTQPVFLFIGYICSFIYSYYLGKTKALIINVTVFVLIIIYALYYSSYNHFGVTNIGINIIGNTLTLESIYAGLVKGVHIATGMMWFYCITKTISSDKVIYILGKFCPKLSLFISIILRFVPQVSNRFFCANRAQTSVGKGIFQGNLIQRIHHALCVISIVITWTLDIFMDNAMSMKSRGYTLKGRTAYSLYRFDNRDRSIVIVIFTCLTVIMMAIMLDQTRILINPHIIMNPITFFSYVFYGVYMLYCLLPMILNVYGTLKANYNNS